MSRTTTLSSSAGVSTALILDPTARTTSVLLTNSVAGASGSFTIEASLDDPSVVGSPAATWGVISSGIAMLSSTFTNGVMYTILSPIAGVRINSTANLNTNTFTLKALQSITA